MNIVVKIENSTGKKTLFEIGEIVMDILQQVRKQKTAARVAQNYKLGTLYLVADSSRTTLDLQLCGVVRDLIGTVHADRLVFAVENPSYGMRGIESLREWRSDGSSKYFELGEDEEIAA